MIPFNNRFHGHSSLAYVYKNGQAIRSHLFVLKFIVNPHRKASRVAVVVSKKVLKSAVRRNRIRRKIYENIHHQLSNMNRVYDIVIIVSSSELLSTPYNEISDQISQMFDQASILK